MSHITHFYHLSALDFINTTCFPGMAPWLPTYTSNSVTTEDGSLGSTLVLHYVTALEKRRKLHTAGAIFSGRQPIQNALVPGGVTTLFSSTYPLSAESGTDYDMFGPYKASEMQTTFKALLNDVRSFINTTYIPDVVTVANSYSSFWSQGVGCQNLLAYGDYPTNSTGTLAIKRGVVTGTVATVFNQANIAEYVDNSYYDYGALETGAGLHPFNGKTVPNMAGGYSWIKAPRMVSGTTVTVYEVGPLARMVRTHVSTTQVTANDTVSGGTSLGEAVPSLNSGASLGFYSVSALITNALSLTQGPQPVTALYSALGRHAARALETKYICDLMAGGSGGGAAWIDQLTPNASCYTYKRIPKQISTGYGLTEAPRGALGHWIKIEGRKVAKYQCVVPSTWNFSPAVGTVTSGSKTNRGAVEQSLVSSTIGTDPTSQVVNLLRLVHPFDCCIACAVHVVNPEGKETLKFAIGPDGRPANIEVKE